MKRRIAINGMGRIGRLVLRHVMQSEKLELVAVNDIAAPGNIAYLLRHDSVYPDPIERITADEGTLYWGDQAIALHSQDSPRQLPWRELEIDTVVEATGAFRGKGEPELHLQAGGKRVVVTAPTKDPDHLMVCMGVNEDAFDPEHHRVVSNASCTTNCLAPVLKVLDAAFGIETAFMTTVHAYTSSQSIVDGPHKKLRRGRAAAVSIVPTTSGATTATEKVLPQLEGKLDGLAMRVPVSAGSIVDLVAQTTRVIDRDRVAEAFRQASQTDRLMGILGVTDDELVSVDIVGSEHSALVDLGEIRVLGDRALKVLAWYDNEWGYAKRVVDLTAYMASRGRGRMAS